MSSPNHIRAKLERDYRICMSRYERAELATETIVGLKALAEADRRIQAERRVLKEKMERLDYLLRLQVDPLWNPDHLTPLHRHRTGRQGAISKAAYRVLKSAIEPMPVRAVARLVAAELGVEATEREINRLDVAIHGSMKRRLADGEVEKVDGRPTRWRVPNTKSGWVSPPSLSASAPLRRVAGSGPGRSLGASANSRLVLDQG